MYKTMLKEFLGIIMVSIAIIVMTFAFAEAAEAADVQKEAPIVSVGGTSENPVGQDDVNIGLARGKFFINCVTISGADCSGFYRFETSEEVYNFLMSKEVAESLRCVKSGQPRRNQLIMSESTATLLAQLANQINNETQAKDEGPCFSMNQVPAELTPDQIRALSSAGIDTPIVIEVSSTKKVVPGGAIGKFTSKAKPVFEVMDAISNFSNIRDMFRGNRW